MQLSVSLLSGSIGATIHGVNLSDSINDDEFKFIYDALVKHKIIAFPNQMTMSPADHVTFSRKFGECDVHSNSQYLLEHFPEILILSNDMKDGKPIGVVDAGVEWHSDLSWQTDPPLGSILHCLQNPDHGGNTGFINMAAVFRILPEPLKQRILGLEGIHSVSKLINRRVTISKNRVNAREFYAEQLEKHPPVQHPLVYRHPESGELVLFASPRFTIDIAGTAEDESQAILDELFTYLEDPSVRLEYQWSLGDVVMWDNRSVLHCAFGGYSYPDIRRINRTTVLCDQATRLQPVTW